MIFVHGQILLLGPQISQEFQSEYLHVMGLLFEVCCGAHVIPNVPMDHHNQEEANCGPNVSHMHALSIIFPFLHLTHIHFQPPSICPYHTHSLTGTMSHSEVALITGIN